MQTYFFDKTLTIRRERVISGDRTAFSATSTAWGLSLQPLADERAEPLEGYAVKLYTAYVDTNCEATEGDQIVIDGKTYLVRGSSEFDFGGLTHKRLAVTQKTGDV